jgi:N-acetylmuramoyl-L-alanine amidase
MKVVISSGHGKHIRGAEGPEPWGLDEVNEARRVVDYAADVMEDLGVSVTVFHDDVSDDQDENLKRIVDFHNNQGKHDLDISVHFNSADFNGSNQTNNPVGTEVFYESSSGKEWAKEIVDAMAASSGLINRGAKDGNLYFLSNTAAVAVLLEICFVNSEADVNIYHEKFEQICKAIATTVAGSEVQPGPTPPPAEEGLFHAEGKCSEFGGPDDTGVSPSEGLAFIFDVDEAPHLFLPYQPSGTTGLARRLNPYVCYVACRWDYDVTSKEMLRDSGQRALVRANDWEMLAFPADWGPHGDTNRVADLSPGLMEALGITTDDEVEVIYPWPE